MENLDQRKPQPPPHPTHVQSQAQPPVQAQNRTPAQTPTHTPTQTPAQTPAHTPAHTPGLESLTPGLERQQIIAESQASTSNFILTTTTNSPSITPATMNPNTNQSTSFNITPSPTITYITPVTDVHNTVIEKTSDSIHKAESIPELSERHERKSDHKSESRKSDHKSESRKSDHKSETRKSDHKIEYETKFSDSYIESEKPNKPIECYSAQKVYPDQSRFFVNYLYKTFKNIRHFLKNLINFVLMKITSN